MITLTFKEAISEVKKIRKIDISVEDIWDKILDRTIRTKEFNDELRVCYNDILFCFNPEIFTITLAKQKRKEFVENNYEEMWDRKMIGSFEDEEDEFDGLYSSSLPCYESDLWTMRSRKVYLKKEEEAYNE